MKGVIALAGVLALALAGVVRGAVVVVPNGNAGTLGSGQDVTPLRNYGTGGSRYQEVFGAGQFGGFGAAEAITGIAFRAKQPLFGSFIGNSVTVSDILVRLSTTQKDDVTTLDGVFANNIGPDVTTVYSGSLTMTTPTSGTTAFGYVINLQTPFVYQKGLGNLLLDVLIPDNAVVSGNGSSSFARFDTVTDAFPSADGVGSATGASGSAVQGSNSTTGVVVQFTGVAVPEPASLSLIGLGVMGLAARRRRVG